MGINMQKAKEDFLKNPLIPAKELLKKYNVTIEELCSIFKEIRIDKQSQNKLDSWGPGDGYCTRVMKDVLQVAPVIEAIHKNEPVYPTVLELHPGPACPCACVFCYSKGESVLSSECSGYCTDPSTQLLTSDQIISVVNTLVEKGCISIYFSGGLEPFSTNITVDVLRRLPEKPNVRIYTNGVPKFLTNDVLELAIRRASQIRFSIHAATPETYKMVQMPHNKNGDKIFFQVLERVKNALEIQKRLVDSGMPASQIGVTFLTVPANHSEIESAVEMWSKLGLNFFDIGNDALTEDYRTEALQTQQRKKLQESFERIKNRSDKGELGKLKVRPSRESVQTLLPCILGKRSASKCYAPFLKAVIDPYGYRWACCMRAHPAFQHKKFCVGEIINSGMDFEQYVSEQQQALPSKKELPLPWHCDECTEFEYVSNICIEKLLDDLDCGISLSEQPFVPGSITRSRLV